MGTTATESITDLDLIGEIKSYIEQNTCVLILGPLFGTSNTGEKAHSVVRKALAQFDLDDDFDNLFISKSNDAAHNPRILSRLMNAYKEIQPNKVYEQILTLGFRAIVTCTADNLLNRASKSSNAYDFYYFSYRGNPSNTNDNIDSLRKELNSQDTLPVILSKKPVIYNVFGNIDEINSVILDYDSLYDFLINIMRADEEFPLQLTSILSQANAFLFMGFDLTKWYIPLIIRRLNKFILSGNRNRGSVFAYACMDDTPAMAPEVPRNLNKYPLTINDFKEFGSLEVIARLREIVVNPMAADKLMFDEWEKYLVQNGLEQFFEFYQQQNYSGSFKQDFVRLNYTFTEENRKYAKTLITQEQFDVKCQRIVEELLRIFKSI